MSLETEQVRDHFRAQVSDYQGLMTRLIPFYDDQRDMMLNLIPFGRKQSVRVLDLGCGPGLLSSRILAEYENVELTAFDLTNEMLESCRALLGNTDRVTYRLGDFRTDDLGSGYGAIVASLSLHHLRITERPDALRRIYDSLQGGGVLIAAEVIVDESPVVCERQYELWRAFMTQNGEDGNYWYRRHREKDHPAPISTLVSMLTDAGFEAAGCFWRYLNFAVIAARKAAV